MLVIEWLLTNRKAMPLEIPFQVVSGEEREATEM
jgi:hypothetical protein